MSTSLLYHAYGVRGYRYVRTQYVGGGVRFTVQRTSETCCCALCESKNVWRQGSVTREFHSLPIGSRPVTLVAEISRLLCRDCGMTRQAAVGFAEPRRTGRCRHLRCPATA